MKISISLFFCLLFCACTSNSNKSAPDSLKTKNLNNSIELMTKKDVKTLNTDSNSEFERKIYLKIDEIHTGKVYTNSDKLNVFYRVLVIPEEENIMLLAENIAIGEEGGKYRLLKMIRLTDNDSALPKFGLGDVDSLKFVDSVRIQGYFNDKKKIINLDKLKSFRASY